MIALIGPLMVILAALTFVVNRYMVNGMEKPKSEINANVMVYHNSMYNYALGNLMSQPTPYTIPSNTTTYLNNINYAAQGDYQAQILTDPSTNIKYLVTSFSAIGGSSTFASRVIGSIAGDLQKPNSGFNQNYQIKIILTNSGCTGTVLNTGLAGNNMISQGIYGPIFTSMCNTTISVPVKTYVIMEPLQ